MTAVVLIARSTTRRLLRTKRVIGLSLLTGATAPILLLLSFGRNDLEVLEFYHGLTVIFGMILAYPIAAIVLSTAALGEERKEHTMPFLTLKPVPRPTIAAAVILSAAIAAFTLMSSGSVATWIVLGLFTGEWGVLWPTSVANAVASLGAAAVFTPLGLLWSRATLAGLAYLFIWETIIAGIVSGITASSLYRIAITAYAAFAQLPPDIAEGIEDILGNGRLQPGAGGAFAKVFVLCAISVFATAALLRIRDLAEE